MSSRRKIESSRANGAKSKGPKTPEGKRHSSMNAVKHGILARICVLSPESREAFENLLAANIASIQPANYVEYDLVEQMTTASWRMRRIWAVECETLEGEIQKTPDRGCDATLIAEAHANACARSNHLELLDRYEKRFHRVYHRSIHSLTLLRSLPPLPDPAAPPAPKPAPAPKKSPGKTNPIPKPDTTRAGDFRPAALSAIALLALLFTLGIAAASARPHLAPTNSKWIQSGQVRPAQRLLQSPAYSAPGVRREGKPFADSYARLPEG